MAGSAPVDAKGVKFDLAQVGAWVEGHMLLSLLIVLVVYAFWISRRNGLLGLILESRTEKRKLDA